MRLMLDTSNLKFMVSKAPEPKMDNQTGVQKHDRQTNAPLNVTELVARESGNGAEVIKVTTAGALPNVTEDQQVTARNLQALPWAQNGRNGVAFLPSRSSPYRSASPPPRPPCPDRLVNHTGATMTHNTENAEREAWSQYLAALHVQEAAWISRTVAHRLWLFTREPGDTNDPFSLAEREYAECADQTRQLRAKWQQIAYPMAGVELPAEWKPAKHATS